MSVGYACDVVDGTASTSKNSPANAGRDNNLIQMLTFILF